MVDGVGGARPLVLGSIPGYTTKDPRRNVSRKGVYMSVSTCRSVGGRREIGLAVVVVVVWAGCGGGGWWGCQIPVVSRAARGRRAGSPAKSGSVMVARRRGNRRRAPGRLAVLGRARGIVCPDVLVGVVRRRRRLVRVVEEVGIVVATATRRSRRHGCVVSLGNVKYNVCSVYRYSNYYRPVCCLRVR